ncbi:TrmH family RNA methyltransferase [Treponema sp. OMZ 840]|uniref:TrmH family RNA methyltransferase n=1 Tax=Treponema sp. OMZ 840 TaxID=244313 RepID=UPI003D8C0BCC
MHGGFRRRKLILTLGALERDIIGIPDTTLQKSQSAFRFLSRQDYIKQIIRIIIEDPKLPPEAQAQLKQMLNAFPFDERRICNTARNFLLAIAGTPSAEWDLIIAPHPGYGAEALHNQTRDTAQNAQCAHTVPSAAHNAPYAASPENRAGTSVCARPFHSGLFVYAEDIRSPFNLGSIFRTAEAFGAEKLFLSPFCTDPAHPRALRSAMGCIGLLPHERLPLDDILARMPGIPVFALETGGTALNSFVFPKKGIVVIGSEELGINPETLKKAAYGTVTIPVSGIKASLNVGVAFGILMQAWAATRCAADTDSNRESV